MTEGALAIEGRDGSKAEIYYHLLTMTTPAGDVYSVSGLDKALTPLDLWESYERIVQDAMDNYVNIVWRERFRDRLHELDKDALTKFYTDNNALVLEGVGRVAAGDFDAEYIQGLTNRYNSLWDKAGAVGYYSAVKLLGDLDKAHKHLRNIIRTGDNSERLSL